MNEQLLRNAIPANDNALGAPGVERAGASVRVRVVTSEGREGVLRCLVLRTGARKEAC